MVTPATMGWNMVSSSWSPRKYQGALDGLGVWLKLASSSRGALTKIENSRVKAVMNRQATNSATSRWGHTWTLSMGLALVSWMEPDLTTVSRRWVWPPGPAATGGGAAAGGSATATVPPESPAGASASPVAARAARDRSSRWAGILAAASGSAAPPGAAGA